MVAHPVVVPVVARTATAPAIGALSLHRLLHSCKMQILQDASVDEVGQFIVTTRLKYIMGFREKGDAKPSVGFNDSN